ncbi:hypothetical protein ACFQ71_02985 [Streptomyces sp. NPDC056534]|uniref:hypothetical protein n=1 Tax=Streptomyces sp. NPDC056534 TaxID=3345857 RepID=UPI0036B28621
MLPTQKTWAPREKATSALLNQQVRDVQRWLESPPDFEFSRSEAFTLVGGTTATLPWNGTLSSNGFNVAKDGAGKVTSVSPRYRGMYLIHAQVCGKVNAVLSHLYLELNVNGTARQVGAISFESTAYMDSVLLTALIELEVGDTVSTRVYTSSGRTATLTSTAEQQVASTFFGYWIGA